MMIPAYREDCIAAIATPPGIGALGIIRISGTDAIDKANLLFPKKDLNTVKSHSLHFGPLVFEGEWIDEVLVSVFRAPHSFTGENSIEISCHGSPYILQKTMEALVSTGVRPAEPGEYTMRAFMKGRMDLSQAEAVADLIAAESEAAHKTALQQMRGGFSNKIKTLRQQLLHFASLIELELDFAEEDVKFADKAQLQALLTEIYVEVEKLAESFRLGNVIKSGVKVVIAGRPNAGKSTLLNALLNEERAIVSEIPGTTRDTIEDILVIDGIKFRFIDTAGIRESTETIERIGIGRTHEKIKEADIIIYLFDINTTTPEMLKEDIALLPAEKKIILAANKIDQQSNSPAYRLSPIAYRLISAKTGLHIEDLKKHLVSILDIDTHLQDSNETIITNIRHYNSLVNILHAVNQINEGIETGITGDFLAADIKQALHSMSEITGEITNDEILGNIFGKFCIGK
jgi:tRNA modification GTPase